MKTTGANNLPDKFKYLLTVPECPKIVTEGLKLYGLEETPGPVHTPFIMGMAKTLGLEKIYTNDETAWCGLVHAYLLTRAGKFIPFDKYDLLRADQYRKFGVAVKKSEAALGDTLVFVRPGGGHVGTYVGETLTTFFVQGGTQRNKFNITEIEKERCVAVRRPVYINQPAGVQKFFLNTSGILSTNEA